MKTVNKSTLINALNDWLNIQSFPSDSSNNGLQVDSSKISFTKVCSGVDASLPFFEAAASAGADLLICHHGISWGDSLKQITNLNFEWIRFLIEHKMALWACHLPVDAHPTLGNNALLADAIGLQNRSPFGTYHGYSLGFSGTLSTPLSRNDFSNLLRTKISPNIQIIPAGKDTISSVGIVSGGASDMVQDAINENLDAYVNGEINLQTYNVALQNHINFFAVGHYASERFGIRAIGNLIAQSFGIEHEFIDLDLPY